MNLSELLKEEKHEKIMVYGESGVGKTCFASGFPGPTYFADFDGKISSAASFLAEKNPSKLSQIDYDQFTDKLKKQQINPYAYFLKKLSDLEKDPKYKTYVIDSMTTLSDAMMEHIIASNPTIKGPMPGVPGMQHYMLLSLQFKQLLKRLLALPGHVVMIGHISIDKDELTGRVIRRPMLSGKLAEQVPILFEEVYVAYAESKDGKTTHFAQTRATNGYVCRTQKPNMPEKVELSYEAISKYSKGKL